MRTVRSVALLAVVMLVALAAADAAAQALSPDLLKAFPFRAVGPTRQSGRFVDVAVPDQQPHTIYMATGSGGLWKSVNAGISWAPIFDNQPVISIGDIAVAPSNPNIVWVGTGEHTASRSTYWGDGVYKSIDAGKTWTNMGLAQTFHIGRIVIDPRNPDIVYVAALGKLYAENDDRGVYKTIDGGKTWTKSLDVKIDGRAIGACELVIDPKNPKVLYAATYDKVRTPWTFNLGGPGSAIYKTVDAGKTWKKLETGLPAAPLGRIGLDIYAKNPNILYANIENANKPGMSAADRLKELAESKSSNAIIGEEVYRSDDGGATWRKVSPEKQKVGGGPGYYYMQIRIDPNDVNTLYVLSVRTQKSTDGGKTWSAAFNFGGDDHALWINPSNSNHIILGYDHGMGITYDAGKNWYHPDELPLAQFYAIGYDMQVPYNVYGGLQDNGSVRGPSTMRGGRPIPFEAWQTVGGGDGMHNVVDPTNRYLYNASQFGVIQRTDLYTGDVRPIRHTNNDLRYQWNAPILVSPHNGDTIYQGANKLLKSTSRGDNWLEISPDLTTNDKTKLTTGKGGDGNIQYCTITTVDESRLVRDLLYVGTDDGNVWVTKDGGKNWTKLNDKIPGHKGLWVTRLIASQHQPGTAYVTFNGYRVDDFKAYIYKTTDYGQSWTPITGLPDKAVNVIREDPVNPNLLFVGVDFGLYVTIDGGKTWAEMKTGMPTQPVHDLQIHPRERDLIVGTHGRGIFIADISALQELSENVLASDVHLFDVESKVKWVVRRPNVVAYTNFNGESDPNGMMINYYLKTPVQGDVQVKIMKGAHVVAESKGPNAAGINRILWNMRWTPLGPASPQGRAGFGQQAAAQPVYPTFGGTTAADPGEYTIVVTAGGKTLMKKAQVLEDVWFDKVF